MKEKDIIEKILKGDKNSYKQFVDKYGQKIFAYLYRFLGNDKGNAQDLTQEVFLKAYKNLEKFDKTKAFSPWLYRIAHNEAVNFIKKNAKKKDTYLESKDLENISSNKASHLEVLNKEDTKKEVTEALNKISPKSRQILMLYYFEEMDYKQISKIINKPKSTVGVMIMRAKEELKKKLKY